MSHNPVDWWGWWALIQENNPGCYDWSVVIITNNPLGWSPRPNHDIPW